MARTYRLTTLRRVGNLAIAAAVRTGLGPARYVLLTVTGRRTGQPRSTPIRLLRHDGHEWLVAPYGEVAWVHNARAAGEVTLRRGRHSTPYTVVECGPDEAGPVLKEYARSEPVTRPYFDAQPSDPPATFAAEAGRHPVFRLEPRRGQV